MRKITKSILLLTSAVCLSSSQLSAVTTDPVGYVTLTLHGNGTTSRSFVPLAAQLVPAPITQLSPSSVTGATINFDGTPLDSVDLGFTDSEGNSAFYLEIVEPQALAGQIVDIISNTSNSVLTVESDLGSMLDSSSIVAFRRYLQIQDVFGESNEAGLTSGADAEGSDTLRLSNANGVLTTYYYQTDTLGFLGGDGWRTDGDNSTDHSTKRIAPDQSIVVSRLPGGSTLTRVLSGNVRVRTLPTPMAVGLNAINTPFPVDVTLGESGLFSEVPGEGISGGADVDSADVVYIYEPSTENPAQARLEKYYYQIDNLGFLGGTGWRRDGDILTDQSNKLISASTGLIVAIENSTSVLMPSPFASNE